MTDKGCEPGDGCCAPASLRLPERQTLNGVTAMGCNADAACGCHGGVPVFDGLDPRYKRVLWTAIGINGEMFVVEMAAGQIAGSQALKADALDFPRRYRDLRLKFGSNRDRIENSGKQPPCSRAYP